eukprot:tig00021612_g22863.t1
MKQQARGGPQQVSGAPASGPSFSLADFEIAPEDVQVCAMPRGPPFHPILRQEPLGTGAYSNVYLGVWQGSEVAVKVMNYTRLDPAAVKSFKEEAQILSRLRHPNICAFYGACLRPPDVLLLVTELCPRGNLHEYLRNKLQLREKLTLFRGVAAGMRYLLSRRPPIQHRDLKSLNVLIGPDGTPKIGDFGLAKLMSPESAQSTAPTMGSCAWLAPECLTGQGRPSDKSDVYSFGVMLWEAVVDGELPWQGCQPNQVVSRVGFQGERLAIPRGCDALLAELMHRCWAHRPEDRPSFEELYHALDARCQGLELPFAQAVQAGQQGLPGPWTTRHSDSPHSSSAYGTGASRAAAPPPRAGGGFFDQLADGFANLRNSAAEFFAGQRNSYYGPPSSAPGLPPPYAQASAGPGGPSGGAPAGFKRPSGKHEGYKCSECGKTPVGLRLICEKCHRYHVCEGCFYKRIHQLRHPTHRWVVQVEPRGPLVRLENLPAHLQPAVAGQTPSPPAPGQQQLSSRLHSGPQGPGTPGYAPATPPRPPGPNSQPASPFAVGPHQQPQQAHGARAVTDRPAEGGEKHDGYRCSECIRVPTGPRLICEQCHTYWICQVCYAKRIHQVRHPTHTWLVQNKPRAPIVPLPDSNLVTHPSAPIV